jgi:hypothetical protein
MKPKSTQGVGRKGTIEANGLAINVKILDYKTAYGKERWLVAPVSGSGQAWIQRVSIK